MKLSVGSYVLIYEKENIANDIIFLKIFFNVIKILKLSHFRDVEVHDECMEWIRCIFTPSFVKIKAIYFLLCVLDFGK